MKRKFKNKDDGHIIEIIGEGYLIYQELFDYDYNKQHGTINWLRTDRWVEIVDNKEIAVVEDIHMHIK